MLDTIRIRVLTLGCGHPIGHIQRVAVNPNGTVLDAHWRRLLRDARLDGCCEVVKDEKPKESKPRTVRKPEPEGEAS